MTGIEELIAESNAHSPAQQKAEREKLAAQLEDKLGAKPAMSGEGITRLRFIPSAPTQDEPKPRPEQKPSD